MPTPENRPPEELWRMVEDVLERVKRIEREQAEQTAILKEIQLAVGPGPAVKFSITYTGETMAKAKATVDFQLLDNGTATATLTPVDAAGNPTSMPTGATVPAWTSSSPAITVAAAPDGLSATLTPTGLATGVIITATATLADGVTTLTGSGNPIDVIAGAATGFQITEQ